MKNLVLMVWRETKTHVFVFFGPFAEDKDIWIKVQHEIKIKRNMPGFSLHNWSLHISLNEKNFVLYYKKILNLNINFFVPKTTFRLPKPKLCGRNKKNNILL